MSQYARFLQEASCDFTLWEETHVGMHKDQPGFICMASLWMSRLLPFQCSLDAPSLELKRRETRRIIIQDLTWTGGGHGCRS